MAGSKQHQDLGPHSRSRHAELGGIAGEIPRSPEAPEPWDATQLFDAVQPYEPSKTMAAWEGFVTSRSRDACPLVRSVIEHSWRRSALSGVDPGGRGSDFALSGDELWGLRQTNDDLLAAARQTIRYVAEVLGGAATMVVLTDHKGIILEAGGDPRTIDAGHDIRLEVGAAWGETVTGTNGIGTALVTGKPVYVRAAEHLLGHDRDAVGGQSFFGTKDVGFLDLYDVETGKISHQFGDQGRIDSLGFSADGSTLAMASGEKITLFDAKGDAEKRILAGHDYLDGENAAGVFGVKSAVDEFVAQHGLRLEVTQETDWPSWYAWI